MRPTFGSLFAGIGGFDLGLERAGWTPAWQVEVDPFRQGVLARHWPAVPRYGDIREIDWSEVPRVDLVAGGFPCQDLSAAGKLAGLHGPRSGLHQEMLYAIERLEPEWVLIENVYHTWRRWVPQLRGALYELGYSSLPLRVRALEVGAPHIRARGFLAAGRCHGAVVSLRDEWRWPWDLANELGSGLAQRQGVGGDPRPQREAAERDGGGGREGDLPDADGRLLRHEPGRREAGGAAAKPGDDGAEGDLRDAGEVGRAAGLDDEGARPRPASRPGRWLPEPDVGRVASRVSARVDRLSSIGDAVVPQVVEWIGRRMRLEEARRGLW